MKDLFFRACAEQIVGPERRGRVRIKLGAAKVA